MKYFVTGGAGFIGSHLVKALLRDEDDCHVTVFDNLSSGRMRHLDGVAERQNLNIVEGDMKDLNSLGTAICDSDVVYHFASNPDIARAATEPDIDFWEGTYLTNNLLEAMREAGVAKLLYASGSGVYGDTGNLAVPEDYSPKLPISTYGASKLACEVLICSYCHMFGIAASAFRFANVVGPNQTHGVGYDFVRRLSESPAELTILGNGKQSKPYIYVSDVVAAMRCVETQLASRFRQYNVSTLDFLSVDEIAEIAVRLMKLKDVQFRYTGGDRGWKGDVPVVRLKSDRIRALGWRSEYASREAMSKSILAMLEMSAPPRVAQ